MSEDFSVDEQESSEEGTASTKAKRKYVPGSGDEAPFKRLKSGTADSGEDSEDKEPSQEEYSGQPVGDYELPDESSDESESSQGTRADLEYHELFIRTAVAWAKDNQGRIARVCQTAGGWESWLEVELYLALQDAGVEVTRQPPFEVDTTGGSRADLFLGNRFLIEMKVETAKEKASAFAKRVVTDLNKVDKKAKDRPASVVGFVWSQESSAACTTQIGQPIRAGILSIFHDASLGT